MSGSPDRCRVHGRIQHPHRQSDRQTRRSSHITQCLSEENVNIAFMRLFREDKGANAFTVVESDETIPSSVLDKIKTHEHVSDLMLIQM